MTAVENEVPLSAAGNPIGFGRMPRKEDVRFLRGRGNYVDDINLPGMLHSAILRSPYAHARIVSIDTSAAEVSIETILAWAYGLRRIALWSMPGRLMSST